ncbi:MAG: KGG domain-containing protein [Polyangia bacterium]
MAQNQRGFAAMEPEQQRKIASKGGKAAHQSGHAHEWDSTEAAQAGRKGGLASHHERSSKSMRPPLHEQYVDPEGRGSEERWIEGQATDEREGDEPQAARGNPSSARSSEQEGRR